MLRVYSPGNTINLVYLGRVHSATISSVKVIESKFLGIFPRQDYEYTMEIDPGSKTSMRNFRVSSKSLEKAITQAEKMMKKDKKA